MAKRVIISLVLLVFIMGVFTTHLQPMAKDCVKMHKQCRRQVMAGDYGFVKTVVFLTACDIGAAACMVGL